VALDWVEIKYYRLYKASDDCLDFTRPEGSLNGLYHFALTNFSSPDISVYKVGKSKLRDFKIVRNSGTGTYSVNLQDYVHDDTTQYWAACGSVLRIPIAVRLDTIAGLGSNVDGANIVIITRQEWTNSLQKLTDFYADNNLSARVVGIRDIYDEFSAGIVTPFAVKEFLQYAYSNWTPAPEYVLLVGDAGLREEQSIPPYFFQSNKFGACASDFWYSLVDDDEVPDYALGRWPCSTAEERELLIDKRINYTKQNLIGEWNNELLFIAGTQDDNPDVFRNQSENMIQRQIGKEFNVNRIYINPASAGTRFFGGSDTLLYLFNKGIALCDFMGHGGGAVWADRSLFNSSHIKYLDNLDRLPFLTSLTCFTADFTNVTGLGEMMILAENGGAIGLWGATSVGWIKNDYLLAKPFYDVIFESGMTVGKAIQIAKIRYLTEQGNHDQYKSSMLNSYNLIGDPTVALPFPQESVLLNLDKTNPAAGDAVNLSGTLPFTKGEMAIQLYDSSKYAIYSEPLSVQFNSATFNQQIILPDTINSGNTFINYYLKSSTGTSDAHGVTLFDIQGLTFYGFKCTPSLPSRNTPIALTINTELSDIQSLFCEIDTVSTSESLDNDGIEQIVSFQTDSLLMQISLATVSGIATQWRTAQSFSIGTPGKLIAVRFVAINSGGNRTVSQSYLIKVKKAPDFYPVSIEQGGTRFPEIIAKIYYLGDDTLQIKVKVERLENGQSTGIFGEGLYTFLPNRTTAIGFPGFPGNGSASFKVTADPDLQIPESSESNNSLTQSLEINTFAVLPGLGTTYYGIQNDTIRVAGIFEVVISPQSVSDSAVLILKSDTTLTISGQPKFSLISPSSEYSRFGLNAAWGSGLNSSDQAISLKIDLTECAETNQTDLAIGKWNPILGIWYEEESGATGNSLTTVTTLPGKFSLIRNSDTNPPSLELNLDGQQFFQNSYVSDRPSISIIGEDDNGVRFDKEGIVVYIDDDQVGFESLSTPDTVSDGHYIAIQFRPELNDGNHTISATLKDAAGNSTTETVDFIVSDKLKLIDYGNFPNPFKTQTTFIYELTQRTTILKINIYTGSGRLIRTLESSDIYTAGPDLNEGGYHEVTWDGLDENGNYVANGVYFYKIYARRGSKVVSKTGKLAKTR
ncbi:MAG: C25 family cysteine peptidase, partial [Candidatus Neomarinimicrobiota bacterium]